MKKDKILFCLLGLILANCTQAVPTQDEAETLDSGEWSPKIGGQVGEELCGVGYIWAGESCIRLQDEEPTEKVPSDISADLRQARIKTATAEAVKENTEYDYDNFKKIKSIIGPGFIDIIDDDNTSHSTFMLIYTLQGQSLRKGHRHYQLAVGEAYLKRVGPVNIKEAFDSNGKKFKIQNMGSKGKPDQKYSIKTVGITMPEEYLKNARNGGIQLKLYGEHKDFIVTVPGHYIRGFLDKSQEVF